MIEWIRKYIRKINVLGVSVEFRPPLSSVDNKTELEILAPLQRRFSCSLRRDLKSVKFCQKVSRCFLRVTTGESVGGYLDDEVTTQNDLGFITDAMSPDGLYFSPEFSIEENIRRFLYEFDQASIINCTDLFAGEEEIRAMAAAIGD